MVAALLPLRGRRPAELAAPDDQRLVQQAALLQVRQQGRDRLVGLPGVVAVVQDVAVVVPRLAVAVIDLRHAHAALRQPAGHQAGVGELRRRRTSAGSRPARGSGRTLPAPRSASERPSPARRCATSSWSSAAALLEVLLVHPLQQVELLALRAARQVAVGEVLNARFSGPQLELLMCVPW